MKRYLDLTLVTGLLLTALTGTIQAGQPNYLLLRTHSAPVPRPPMYDHCPNADYGAPAQPYAYGWFGVQPRQHWSRHFGYYRNFTQWSGK